MKKRLLKNCMLLLLCAAVGAGSLSSALSVQAKSTSEKLKEAQQNKKDTEKKLDDTSDRIDDLKDTKHGLQNNLSDLNTQLASVSDKIAEIEGQEADKEAEIEETTKALAAAEEQQAAQYEYIKARIRVVYERGKENYLELFLRTTNFSEFLNRAEYVSKVNQYDEQMLDKYEKLVEDTKEKKAELEEDKAELESLHEDAKVEQAKVQKLVDSTKNSITAYAGAISEAEAEALAYEAKLIAAKNTISALKEQLKKEEELARLSASMKKRSLSEVTIGKGEKEMLAALIQCEAGGEPWAGKIAVGAVVMNRVMSGAFPNTITGVIYQSGQFEPVSSGRFAIVLGQGANSECTKAAEQAMAGSNNIGECLFFRTIVPGIKGTIIGHHVFYLYWTGKYSGYGTAEDSLKDGPGAATGATESSSESSESSESSDEKESEENSDDKSEDTSDEKSDDKGDDEDDEDEEEN